jgi:hypothetical protein
MIFAVQYVCEEGLPSLTESISSLRKLRYEKDKMLDMGRDESARVEFAAAPCCDTDVRPDLNAHLTPRDPACGDPR